MDSLHLRTKRAVDHRILLVLFILNFLAQVDRSNLSFASVDMVAERGFSASVYGFGAGVFFVGVALGGVPHTIMFQRVRPHTWLALMMATWATASLLTAFAATPREFFVARFVLGAAEGALVPVVIACLARFYSVSDVGAAAGTYVSATALAAALGGPMAALILRFNWGHLEGWQWLFVLQAIPVLLLAPFLPKLLPHSPAEARWLSEESRQWLARNTTDSTVAERTEVRVLISSIATMRVLLLTIAFFGINLAFWGLTFWLPQIIKGRFTDLSSSQVSLVSSGAFIAAFVATYGFGRLSKWTGDRRWTLLGLLAASGISLIVSLSIGGAVLPLIFVGLGVALTSGIVAVFYGVPSMTLTGPTGPTQVAVVNGCGLLGGFVGPYAFGALKDATNSPTDGLYVFAAVFFITMLVVIAGWRYYPQLEGGSRKAWEVESEAESPEVFT